MKCLNHYLGILLFIILMVSELNAQAKTKVKLPFLRVYNLEGKKVPKGNIIVFHEDIMLLKHSGKIKEVWYSEIGYLKTKQSAGHNILISSLVGMSIGAIYGIATADPDTWIYSYSQGEGALAFGLLGGIGGVAIGGMAALFKKAITYSINGDQIKWNAFKRQ